jgi:hypothetical protein
MTQRVKNQKLEEKKLTEQIQQKRLTEGVKHDKNISTIRAQRVEQFRLLTGKQEAGMIESLAYSRSHTPKQANRYCSFRFKSGFIPPASPLPSMGSSQLPASIGIALSRLTTPSSKRIDFLK